MPSPMFRDICLDIGNIIRSGTGLTEYLAERSMNLIDIKKISLKAFMDDVTMLSEIYLMITLFTTLANIIFLALLEVKYSAIP